MQRAARPVGRRRPAAATLLVIAGALALGGCSAGSSPVTSGPSASTPVATAVGPVPSKAVVSAVALLARLPVKGRAPLTGYSRGRFGRSWTDDNGAADGHNGCDTRNDILRRDLLRPTLKPGTHSCVVLTGILHDPYTARVIAFRRGVGTSALVQIDHVVALGDAWQTGAQQLTDGQRTDLANDPLELLAVDGPTNESKGDGDAATWLPPNKAYRCAYANRQIEVKARYHLWVTRAEHDALARTLGTCRARRT